MTSWKLFFLPIRQPAAVGLGGLILLTLLTMLPHTGFLYAVVIFLLAPGVLVTLWALAASRSLGVIHMGVSPTRWWLINTGWALIISTVLALLAGLSTVYTNQDANDFRQSVIITNIPDHIAESYADAVIGPHNMPTVVPGQSASDLVFLGDKPIAMFLATCAGLATIFFASTALGMLIGALRRYTGVTVVIVTLIVLVIGYVVAMSLMTRAMVSFEAPVPGLFIALAPLIIVGLPGSWWALHRGRRTAPQPA